MILRMKSKQWNFTWSNRLPDFQNSVSYSYSSVVESIPHLTIQIA